jgi:heme-degrading monooxygenase HmoA
MHIQNVRFHLREMSEEQFRALCDEVAPAFAAIPGLISKVWLASPATNTYGGVYTWVSREAFVAFTASELFQAVATNPNFAQVSSQDFGLLEGPTRVTYGLPGVPA